LSCLYCSAQSQTFMSVGNGSSAVLPCDWRNKSINPSNQSLYIEWRTFSGTVFERRGKEHYEGEGYEGRVDVPEDKLKKGNCSLVLKEVKAEDAGVYQSYLLVNREKRSLQSKRVFIQSVELSVHGKDYEILWACVKQTFMVGRGLDTVTLAGEVFFYATKHKKRKVLSVFFVKVTIITISPYFRDSPSCKNISAHVGSTARLPCDCSTSANQKPVFRWHFKSEFVIESDGTSTAAGSGYEERVEVSKEDLQGGDCSLLLKNIKAADSGAYQCNKIGNKRETVLQRICLSVEGKNTKIQNSFKLNLEFLKYFFNFF
ncbi:hypothetical protein AMEX_G4268, partial [Astyanax mexicanus]